MITKDLGSLLRRSVSWLAKEGTQKKKRFETSGNKTAIRHFLLLRSRQAVRACVRTTTTIAYEEGGGGFGEERQ